MLNNKTQGPRTQVTKSLTLRYDIRQQVTKSLTLKYNIENFENRVRHLAEHQIRLREENEKMIYEIILSYGCETTKQVHDILKTIFDKHNEKIKQKVQQKYEKGEFDIKRRDELIKQKTVKPITLRTIQYAIKNLIRKGKLVKESKRNFRLKNPSDIERYKTINEYSNTISKKIFQISNNNQNILRHLVDVIGTQLVFNFTIIYCLKTNNSINKIDSDNLFIPGPLNTTIQLDELYEFFIKSIKSLMITNNNDKTRSKDDNIKILLDEIGKLYPSVFGDLTSIMKLFQHTKET